MSVFESLGFSRLIGVDVNAKAIEMNKAAHPNYEVKVVDGFDLGEITNVDVVFHSGLLSQV